MGPKGTNGRTVKKKHRKSAKLPWHHNFDSLKKNENVEKSLEKNWNRFGIFFKLRKSLKSWKKKLEKSWGKVGKKLEKKWEKKLKKKLKKVEKKI